MYVKQDHGRVEGQPVKYVRGGVVARGLAFYGFEIDFLKSLSQGAFYCSLSYPEMLYHSQDVESFLLETKQQFWG